MDSPDFTGPSYGSLCCKCSAQFLVYSLAISSSLITSKFSALFSSAASRGTLFCFHIRPDRLSEVQIRISDQAHKVYELCPLFLPNVRLVRLGRHELRMREIRHDSDNDLPGSYRNRIPMIPISFLSDYLGTLYEILLKLPPLFLGWRRSLLISAFLRMMRKSIGKAMSSLWIEKRVKDTAIFIGAAPV